VVGLYDRLFRGGTAPVGRRGDGKPLRRVSGRGNSANRQEGKGDLESESAGGQRGRSKGDWWERGVRGGRNFKKANVWGKAAAKV